jgi:hypothetical protein
VRRSYAAILRAPIHSDAAERPLLGIWLVLALSWIVPILPLVIVVGYVVRALVATERGDALPTFLADGRSLVRRSLGGSLLCLVFLGVPALALLVTVYGALWGTNPSEGVPVGRLLAGSTAVILFGLVGLYLAPIALTTYGQTGSIRSGLSLGTFRSIGGHGAYFFGWTIGCVALSMTAALAGLLANVPQVGPVVAALALAYGLLVTTFVWGRAIGRARTRSS